MATQDVRYIVSVDDAGALRKLQDLGFSMKELKDNTSKADTVFRNLFQTFTLGNIAANAITRLMGSAKGFVESAIQGAIEEEQSQNRLKTALEMTGRARNGGVQSMLDFAEEQSKLTTYTHEEIEATETLLAQLTHLNNAGIRQMTKGVMGLAAVLGPGEGLEGATRMVQRAMEGQTTGLRRAGIIIDETLPKGQQLVEIQRRLLELYPRATAELETMGGKVTQTAKAWGEFKDALGKAVLEAVHAKEILPFLTKQIDNIDQLNEAYRRVYAGLFNPEGASQKNFEGSVRSLAAAFVSEVRPAIAGTTGVMLEFKKVVFDADKVVTDFYNSLGNLSAVDLMDINEVSPGDVVDKLFPPEVTTELPDFLKELMPNFTASVRKETKKEHDYFAGLYNDIARGFGNAFEQLRFSLRGFGDFFIAIWENIKRAFFRIIGEIVAEWIMKTSIMRAVTGFFGHIFGVALPLIALQKGFQGVVSKPTAFLAGEAGPEYVDVRPMRGGGTRGGGSVTNNFYINALDGASVDRVVRQQVVPVLKEVYAHGGL